MSGATSYNERSAQYQEATGEKLSMGQAAAIVTGDVSGGSAAYTAVAGSDPLTGQKVSGADRLENAAHLGVGIGVGLGLKGPMGKYGSEIRAMNAEKSSTVVNEGTGKTPTANPPQVETPPGKLNTTTALEGVKEGAGKLNDAHVKTWESTIIPDETPVVRGGTNTAEKFSKGSGVNVDNNGNLHDVSVNSKSGLSVEELSENIPHNKIGNTTAGAIRNEGGSVRPSPSSNNPNHATMSGITAEKASALMEVIKNPSKKEK